MLVNVFLTASIISAVVFFSMFSFDYYVNLSQAKQIQETYDVISEIKKEIAKQYNKNPDDITRDELIAILPKGKNWEKLFLANRNDSLDFDENSFIDEDGNFIISQEDKLRLFALKSKLNNMSDLSTSTVDTNTNKIKFSVSSEDRNRVDSINLIKKEMKVVKEILYINLDSIDSQNSFDSIITNNSSTDINKMKRYLKIDLKKSKNFMDLRTYKKIKGYL